MAPQRFQHGGQTAPCASPAALGQPGPGRGASTPAGAQRSVCGVAGWALEPLVTSFLRSPGPGPSPPREPLHLACSCPFNFRELNSNGPPHSWLLTEVKPTERQTCPRKGNGVCWVRCGALHPPPSFHGGTPSVIVSNRCPWDKGHQKQRVQEARPSEEGPEGRWVRPRRPWAEGRGAVRGSPPPDRPLSVAAGYPAPDHPLQLHHRGLR